MCEFGPRPPPETAVGNRSKTHLLIHSSKDYSMNPIRRSTQPQPLCYQPYGGYIEQSTMSCIFHGEYHDAVWGTPVLSSQGLFEQLSLCTQQAGISWRVVWNKRLAYREAFCNFDMRSVAQMNEEDLERLLDKSGPWAGRIIQSRSKLHAIIHNARQCVLIEEGYEGGLARFLWERVAAREGADQRDARFVVELRDGAPILLDPAHVNSHADHTSEGYQRAFGVTSAVSDELASILRREGEHKTRHPRFEAFKFLGSVTLQAFLLQCGLLNGHSPTCWKNGRCAGHQQLAATPKSRPRQRQRDAAETQLAATATRSRQKRARESTGYLYGKPAQQRVLSADDVWL